MTQQNGGQNMKKQDKVRPFGWRDKIGYMFGDFGNDFTFIFSTTILMRFYTTVLGISTAVVGTVMMLSRFVDAFTDVAMGRICDKSPVTKAGKFKPWILRMCVPVAAASFLVYQSALTGASMTVKIVYLFVTYILWGSIFYTSINIPYGSMASAISPEPSDRQSLSTFRTMGGVLAGMVIGIIVPIVTYQKIDGRETLIGSRVTATAAVFSVFAIICYLLCYFLVTERVTINNTAEKKSVSTLQMLKNAVNNRALISIIAASIVMLMSQLTMQGMSGYTFPDYYNNADAQSLSTVLMMLAMLIAAVSAKPLAAKIGKAEISSYSNFFAAAVNLALFFVRPQSVWVYCALQMLSWIGLGIFSMVSWALITDVIDHSEIINGVREDGSVYALYSFARKLGQAVAAGLTGWLLAFIGYNSLAAEQQVSQTPQVLSGIFNIATLVPTVGFALLALILKFWYPLTKAKVDENVKLLKEKHRKE